MEPLSKPAAVVLVTWLVTPVLLPVVFQPNEDHWNESTNMELWIIDQREADQGHCRPWQKAADEQNISTNVIVTVNQSVFAELRSCHTHLGPRLSSNTLAQIVKLFCGRRNVTWRDYSESSAPLTTKYNCWPAHDAHHKIRGGWIWTLQANITGFRHGFRRLKAASVCFFFCSFVSFRTVRRL